MRRDAAAATIVGGEAFADIVAVADEHGGDPEKGHASRKPRRSSGRDVPRPTDLLANSAQGR
jgi:hypothetical protein